MTICLLLLPVGTPAAIPINWEVIRDPFRSLCDHEESAVMPISDHVPCFASPFICIFMEEVRREAGKDHASCRHLVIAFVLSCSENTGREVECLGLPYYCRILPDSLIPSEHVTELASGACLRTAMPQVPCYRFRRAGISYCR